MTDSLLQSLCDRCQGRTGPGQFAFLLFNTIAVLVLSCEF